MVDKVRLPLWFKQEIPDTNALRLSRFIAEFGINTVCVSAKCPNLSHCFKNNQLAFLILGDKCSRNCSFCNIKKGRASRENNEPELIAEIVKRLSLKYVVVTSVTRDDLADGGASVFAKTISSVRSNGKRIRIEVLIPDFLGVPEHLNTVIEAGPVVIAHNIETVSRIYPKVRPQSDYRGSLEVLANVKKINPGTLTKSSLMLGLGETRAEVIEAMKDLRAAQCDILTLGQYLAPSESHCPVKEFIHPDKFREYEKAGNDLGFKRTFASPLTRSSYMAEKLYKEITNE